MNSLSQLWKWSKIRRRIAAAEFGMTFIGAGTGEAPPAAQMGHPQGWCLIKLPHLLPQPGPFFLLLCLFCLTSLLPKHDTPLTQHSWCRWPLPDAHGERGTKPHPLPPLGRSPPCSAVTMVGWGEGVPRGSAGLGAAKTMWRHSPLQRSRLSKWFHHPDAAHGHYHNEGSWNLPQMAMCCIYIMDPVQKLWGSLNCF